MARTKEDSNETQLINCLKNERVIVRFIARKRGSVSDPQHFLYGGMAKSAVRQFTVPLLRTGGYVNVLTKDEKNFLEDILGMEPNALSVHNKENNFWDDSNPNSVGRVELHKEDNYLDLSDPLDYIKYKILLANKDIIAPSMQAFQDAPKATYEFVLIEEEQKDKEALMSVSTKAKAYMEFGKIQDDADILKLVIEMIDGRPVANNTKLSTLQSKIGDIIDSNAKTFVKIVSDPLLPTKVLIRRGIEAGIISRRGTYLYYKSDDGSIPLCSEGQEPTFNVAANYLSAPKQQELKFSIEAKLKE